MLPEHSSKANEDNHNKSCSTMAMVDQQSQPTNSRKHSVDQSELNPHMNGILTTKAL